MHILKLNSPLPSWCSLTSLFSSLPPIPHPQNQEKPVWFCLEQVSDKEKYGCHYTASNPAQMREFEGQVLGRPSALASLSLYLHNVGGLIALLPP